MCGCIQHTLQLYTSWTEKTGDFLTMYDIEKALMKREGPRGGRALFLLSRWNILHFTKRSINKTEKVKWTLQG